MLEPSALDSCLRELMRAPRWLVGYSGGIDSSVLLALLVDWCEHQPDAPRLSAIHVNRVLRQLREEGFLTFRNGEVTFDDFDQLVKAADFDAAYLDYDGPMMK